MSRESTTPRALKQATCSHDWTPTFQGGDTYRCKKCGKEIDMTEDEKP